jgi:hypothetical protein
MGVEGASELKAAVSGPGSTGATGASTASRSCCTAGAARPPPPPSTGTASAAAASGGGRPAAAPARRRTRAARQRWTRAHRHFALSPAASLGILHTNQNGVTNIGVTALV